RNYIKAYAAHDSAVNRFADGWLEEVPEFSNWAKGPLPVLRGLNVESLRQFLKELSKVDLNRTQVEYIGEQLRLMHSEGQFHAMGLLGYTSDQGEKTTVETLIFAYEKGEYARLKIPGEPAVFRFDLDSARSSQRRVLMRRGIYSKAIGRILTLLL